MTALLREELQVVNVGLAGFAEAIRSAGGAAVQVEWAPPGPGDPQVSRAVVGAWDRRFDRVVRGSREITITLTARP